MGTLPAAWFCSFPALRRTQWRRTRKVSCNSRECNFGNRHCGQGTKGGPECSLGTRLQRVGWGKRRWAQDSHCVGTFNSSKRCLPHDATLACVSQVERTFVSGDVQGIPRGSGNSESGWILVQGRDRVFRLLWVCCRLDHMHALFVDLIFLFSCVVIDFMVLILPGSRISKSTHLWNKDIIPLAKKLKVRDRARETRCIQSLQVLAYKVRTPCL